MSAEHDHGVYLDELAADADLARVDGIEALHALGPDEILMRQEEEALEAAAGGRAYHEEWTIRAEMFAAVLRDLFADGPEPMLVARRAFNLAKTYKPEILAEHRLESFEAYGDLVGLGRAAMQAHYKKHVPEMVHLAERRTGRNRGMFRAPFQKTETNVEKLSAAQKRTQRANGANRNKGKRRVGNGAG